MPKHERDTYEPDDVRVFDGGEDDEEEGGSHLPAVIVIAGLVLAAFGGVVWLAYNNGVARGRADLPAATAQIAANEQPAVAPSSGVIAPKQIKIYQQQAGSDDVDQEPATAPPARLTKPGAPLALRSQPTEAKPEVVPPAPKPVAVIQSVLPPAKTTPKPVEQALPATGTPAKLVAQAPAKPATLPKAAAATAATGAYVLQIGAYKSQSDADTAWKTFQAKHAALLSGFGPDVRKTDLGDKGVWYRLRVGSFADKDTAAALCDRLKAEGAVCFPAK